MLASEIIAKFELWVDDGTELSASDELDLLNKVYFDVFTERPWEFAKKSFSGTINGTSILLPTDLAYICENGSYSDSQRVNVIENSSPKLIWVGNSYFILINWSDRKQYEGKQGYCYIDIVNKTLVFTTSVSGTITYDYVYFPIALTINDEPLFPAVYHPVLYHLMASDDYIIQQFDKAKSYSNENEQKASYWLNKMQMWNANLLVN